MCAPVVWLPPPPARKDPTLELTCYMVLAQFLKLADLLLAYSPALPARKMVQDLHLTPPAQKASTDELTCYMELAQILLTCCWHTAQLSLHPTMVV